jgi:hypothetical protein
MPRLHQIEHRRSLAENCALLSVSWRIAPESRDNCRGRGRKVAEPIHHAQVKIEADQVTSAYIISLQRSEANLPRLARHVARFQQLPSAPLVDKVLVKLIPKIFVAPLPCYSRERESMEASNLIGELVPKLIRMFQD